MGDIHKYADTSFTFGSRQQTHLDIIALFKGVKNYLYSFVKLRGGRNVETPRQGGLDGEE
jgi:hypothetical protein